MLFGPARVNRSVDRSRHLERRDRATRSVVHGPSAASHRRRRVPSTDGRRSSTAGPCGGERVRPPSPHGYYGDDGV